MKRISALSLSFLAALGLVAAPLSSAAQLRGAPKAPKAGATSVTGPVKSVSGQTFVIARRGSAVTVDASKAKIRVRGKFAKFDAVKPGTMAKATGAMQGG